MGNGRFFKGSLDEIYFYNRALTKNEISIIFNGEEEMLNEENNDGGEDKNCDFRNAQISGNVNISCING